MDFLYLLTPQTPMYTKLLKFRGITESFSDVLFLFAENGLMTGTPNLQAMFMGMV
jgi:hypothetical protein